MQNFLHMYIRLNGDIISFIVRIIIGIVLIINIEKITNKFKNRVVLTYYGCIVGAIIGNFICSTAMNIVIAGIIGIIISIGIIKFCDNNLFIDGTLLFITIYEIIELFFYVFHVNFSEILKMYNDIYADYTTVHVKLIASAVLTFLILGGKHLMQKKDRYVISNRTKYVLLGNYFILGALFTGIGKPSEIIGEWEDLLVPLLNVNYSPYVYVIPMIEIVVIIFMLWRKMGVSGKNREC